MIFKYSVLIFFSILLFLASSCNNYIIEANSVQKIYIEDYKGGSIYNISDNKDIEKILNRINDSRQEFNIFYANVKIIITCNDKEEKVINVNGHCLRIDGVPYVNDVDLEEFLREQMVNLRKSKDFPNW